MNALVFGGNMSEPIYPPPVQRLRAVLKQAIAKDLGVDAGAVKDDEPVGLGGNLRAILNGFALKGVQCEVTLETTLDELLRQILPQTAD